MRAGCAAPVAFSHKQQPCALYQGCMRRSRNIGRARQTQAVPRIFSFAPAGLPSVMTTAIVHSSFGCRVKSFEYHVRGYSGCRNPAILKLQPCDVVSWRPHWRNLAFASRPRCFPLQILRRGNCSFAWLSITCRQHIEKAHTSTRRQVFNRKSLDLHLDINHPPPQCKLLDTSRPTRVHDLMNYKEPGPSRR